MGNRKLKKKIKGLEKQIRLHEDKIRRESLKDYPDYRIIKHWQVEIISFKKGVEKTIRRLNK